MGDLRIGTATSAPAVGKLKLGTTDISKIYSGSTLVWPINPPTDLPIIGAYEVLNLEMAEGIWFSKTATALGTNPIYSSNTGLDITTPTSVDSFTTNDACPSNPSYDAVNFGGHYSGSQTRGAFVLAVDMQVPSNSSSQGMAGGIIVQRRADDTQSWVGATTMSGLQMSNTTNLGFQRQQVNGTTGFYKNNAACPTVTGSFGGCDTLCIESFNNNSFNATRYFAFEQTGEYRIIVGKWLSSGGGCSNIANNTNYTAQIVLSSLYESTPIGQPYHVSTNSNTSTSVNAYAAEYFPGAVKEFFSDQALTTPLTGISGTQYFKPIFVSAGNPNTVTNYELSANGEYIATFDSSGVRTSNIEPNYV